MDEILRDCIVSITAFGSVFGTLYVLLMTRHRERMSLMERGLSTAEFFNQKSTLSATLRYGLFLIGVGVGILFGNFAQTHFDVPRQGAFLAMIFLFGGISLIISFLIERKLNK